MTIFWELFSLSWRGKKALLPCAELIMFVFPLVGFKGSRFHYWAKKPRGKTTSGSYVFYSRRI